MVFKTFSQDFQSNHQSYKYWGNFSLLEVAWGFSNSLENREISSFFEVGKDIIFRP
jgi:hypothetical protein